MLLITSSSGSEKLMIASMSSSGGWQIWREEAGMRRRWAKEGRNKAEMGVGGPDLGQGCGGKRRTVVGRTADPSGGREQSSRIPTRHGAPTLLRRRGLS